jgi:hypothetical protein
MRIFSGLVQPLEVNYEIIWGLIYINLKVRHIFERALSDLFTDISIAFLSLSLQAQAYHRFDE